MIAQHQNIRHAQVALDFLERGLKQTERKYLAEKNDNSSEDYDSQEEMSMPKASNQYNSA